MCKSFNVDFSTMCYNVYCLLFIFALMLACALYVLGVCILASRTKKVSRGLLDEPLVYINKLPVGGCSVKKVMFGSVKFYSNVSVSDNESSFIKLLITPLINIYRSIIKWLYDYRYQLFIMFLFILILFLLFNLNFDFWKKIKDLVNYETVEKKPKKPSIQGFLMYLADCFLSVGKYLWFGSTGFVVEVFWDLVSKANSVVVWIYDHRLSIFYGAVGASLLGMVALVYKVELIKAYNDVKGFFAAVSDGITYIKGLFIKIKKILGVMSEPKTAVKGAITAVVGTTTAAVGSAIKGSWDCITGFVKLPICQVPEILNGDVATQLITDSAINSTAAINPAVNPAGLEVAVNPAVLEAAVIPAGLEAAVNPANLEAAVIPAINPTLNLDAGTTEALLDNAFQLEASASSLASAKSLVSGSMSGLQDLLHLFGRPEKRVTHTIAGLCRDQKIEIVGTIGHDTIVLGHVADFTNAVVQNVPVGVIPALDNIVQPIQLMQVLQGAANLTNHVAPVLAGVLGGVQPDLGEIQPDLGEIQPDLAGDVIGPGAMVPYMGSAASLGGFSTLSSVATSSVRSLIGSHIMNPFTTDPLIEAEIRGSLYRLALDSSRLETVTVLVNGIQSVKSVSSILTDCIRLNTSSSVLTSFFIAAGCSYNYLHGLAQNIDMASMLQIIKTISVPGFNWTDLLAYMQNGGVNKLASGVVNVGVNTLAPGVANAVVNTGYAVYSQLQLTEEWSSTLKIISNCVPWGHIKMFEGDTKGLLSFVKVIIKGLAK